MGQNGNVHEWQESALNAPNNSPSEDRAFRGGGWGSTETNLRASNRGLGAPSLSNTGIGFRVASVVPEPTSALLLLGSGAMLLLRRRRAAV